MLHEEILDFLSQTPPFQFLARGVLRRVADEAKLEFYPAGTLICDGKRPKQVFLYMIKKGIVLVESEEEGGARALCEGELFGLPSAPTGGYAPPQASALTDALCYLVDARTAFDALGGHDELEVFFHERFNRAYFERSANEVYAKSLAATWLGDALRSMTAAEAVGDEHLSAVMSIPVIEAAQRMSETRQSAIILCDEAGQAAGIVTDADLRDKVVARGLDLQTPASEIMAGPIIEIPADALCFDAMLAMARHNVHHLLVTEGEGASKTARGALSYHDLMVAQGGSPLAFIEKIQAASTLTSLSDLAIQLDALTGRLLRGGASAAALTRITAELQERLTARLVEFGVESLGPPPASFAFLLFGVQARREAPLRSQQHNGLVYATPDSSERARKAEEYFRILAIFVRDGLTALGFAPHEQGFMAAEPAWRGDLESWLLFFTRRLPAELPVRPELAGFLDLRPAYGDASLAEALRDALRRQAGALDFQAALAASWRAVPRARGLLLNALINEAGAKRESIDVGQDCLAPLAAWTRSAALGVGLDQVSTLERVKALAQFGAPYDALAEPLSCAVEYCLLLATLHGLEYGRANLTQGGALVRRLSHLERRTLQLVFQTLEKLDSIALQ
jgi:CBS domain-containing protein